MRAALPLGVVGGLGQSILASSVVLFGILAASEAEVGDYGAAFRLIEATIFISWSFSSAILPWFSRHPGTREGPSGLARGFEMSLKGIVSFMLPVAFTFALFAEPLIETLYGADYDGAVVPLQILGAMTVVWGINGVVTAVVVGRGLPRIYIVPALTVVGLTLVLALVLMPTHGAVGAALTTLPAATALALMTIGTTVRVVGPIDPFRVLTAPLLAGATLTGVAILLSGVPWPVAAGLALAAYAIAFLAIEWISYPDDFAHYERILGARRQAAEPT